MWWSFDSNTDMLPEGESKAPPSIESILAGGEHILVSFFKCSLLDVDTYLLEYPYKCKK